MTNLNRARLLTAAILILLGKQTALCQPKGSQPPEHDCAWYQHHILAIDEDGSALMPIINTAGPKAERHYTASYNRMEGENTRGARVNNGALESAVAAHTTVNPDPYNSAMTAALKGRTTVIGYIAAIFQDVNKTRPKPTEIVIYVHGGLNNINGAIAKSALLADVLAKEQKYFIGICWNSNLMPTYDQHLLAVREGLHQKEKAIISAPAMLIADLGGSAVRLPLNFFNFLYQDIYTTHPKGYKRTKLASARYDQILNAARDNPASPLNRIAISEATDGRSQFDKLFVDFGRWMVTYPVKISSTFFLDTLGIQPWKNMIRRTRTMFERESEFIPDLTYVDAARLATYEAQKPKHVVMDTPNFIDKLNYTGRKGAMWHFCNQLEKNLSPENPSRPRTVTIIGHSMGAIVTCEMLQRFHRLPIDNVVLMAAACSVSDFKNKVIPYLEEQDLRAEFSGVAPKGSKFSEPVIKTHVFNLCLQDTAENGEPNPGQLDLSQRGSLLTWIDTLYQSPESENDRTFGRWVNAVLATDDLPKSVLPRITIKGFGLDRARKGNSPVYTAEPGSKDVIDEPTKHGEFTRYEEGSKKRKSNFRFWDPIYRKPEAETVTVSSGGNR